MFTSAFHTTPLCSPNRASIITGQYASRHGIIDNVARDAHSHRLPNYHGILQRLGYETAHVGKWHMGNSGRPRPGYDRWVSFPGHGSIVDPVLNIDGDERQHKGYITDLLNDARRRVPAQAARASPSRCSSPTRRCIPTPSRRPTARSISARAAIAGAERHADLYKGAHFPRRPNALPLGRGGEGQAGLDGGVPAQGQRGLAQGARRHQGRHRRGDPAARRHDGLGRRGHGRGVQGAGGDRRSSTTPSSCSWATTATSSASTGSGPSGASPTRKASSRRSWCAIPPGSSRAR